MSDDNKIALPGASKEQLQKRRDDPGILAGRR
jgi:hypothetical protein